MKKMIMIVCIIGIPSLMHAQTTEEKTGEVVTRNPGVVMPISKMDQSKIYNWGNGQRSTPAGRQAGKRKIRYAKVMGDSAVVVSKPRKKKNME